MKREYFYVCVRHVTFFLSVMHECAWPSFGWLWPFLSGCRWVCGSVTFFGLVWVDLGKCDHFLAGCGWMRPFLCWVWVNVTFFCWVLVCVGGCDLFLLGRVGVTFYWLGMGRCWWVWVSAWFIIAQKYGLVTTKSFINETYKSIEKTQETEYLLTKNSLVGKTSYPFDKKGKGIEQGQDFKHQILRRQMFMK